MDRASIYFIKDGDAGTFDYDEHLPSLPLPELNETLERYYESLLPFGTEAELANSRAVIKKFENGIGKVLHKKLEERAGRMKNWLDEWWDAYAYHVIRLPLNPYIVMAMPLNLNVIGIKEEPANSLKNLALITYYTIEFWHLIHNAKLKPLSSNGGKVKYSSAQYRRFYNTTRVPGLEIDHIEQHFCLAKEGKCPSHGLISGKGRLFIFETLHKDGSIITTLEIYVLLQRIRSILDYEPNGDCVPILTHDFRTGWAQNRQRLMEISTQNKDTLKLIESSSIVIVFDENEPQDYEDVSSIILNGDLHSKWGDRSSTIIAYKNGKFAMVGEHSAYDGTVSVSYAVYITMSMVEEAEPNWNEVKDSKVLELTELKFNLSDQIYDEINRVLKDCDERRTDVLVTYETFRDYGKNFMKACKLHPDSFVQVVMQLAYTLLHESIAPTYETALMRHYYKGRTETLRSCTTDVHKFLKIATNPKANKAEIVKSLRAAVEHHNHMMNEARKGHGVDRHLFGLWCVAHEQNIKIPDFYDDPLYAKSGGGGNFVLSTSTLGYTPFVGFVAPMVLDGYGVFYSITDDIIYLQISAFRSSTKTAPHKFNEAFVQTFRRIRHLIEEVQNSKL